MMVFTCLIALSIFIRSERDNFDSDFAMIWPSLMIILVVYALFES